MTNIFSCNPSYYTAAECLVGGNWFRKTQNIGGKGRPWGLLFSSRGYIPFPHPEAMACPEQMKVRAPGKWHLTFSV